MAIGNSARCGIRGLFAGAARVAGIYVGRDLKGAGA